MGTQFIAIASNLCESYVDSIKSVQGERRLKSAYISTKEEITNVGVLSYF